VLQRLSQGKANSNSKISKVKCQLPTLDFGRIEALLYSTGAYASIGRLIEFIFYIYTYNHFISKCRMYSILPYKIIPHELLSTIAAAP